MRYLLDTHAFLWAVAQPKKLPRRVIQIIEDPDNEVFLSAVSIWEAAIKIRSGRLEIGGRAATDLLDEASDLNVQLIDLVPEEAASNTALTENTHFDPFDRMLIWQAISRNLILISGDSEFRNFSADGLKLLWN